MEGKVEELNALRSAFDYILARKNAGLDASRSSEDCPAAPTIAASSSPASL
jgi:hypothetical protein